MIKKLLLMGILLGAVRAGAQTYTPTADNLAARQNFQDMKFGLFIHWGIYSGLARASG